MSIWGDGENTKDYLFLADFLDAVQAVVTRGVTGTFNVASEQSLSVNDIVSLVESLTGKKLRLAHCAAFSWDVEKSYISARKLRKATGWHARHRSRGSHPGADRSGAEVRLKDVRSAVRDALALPARLSHARRLSVIRRSDSQHAGHFLWRSAAKGAA